MSSEQSPEAPQPPKPQNTQAKSKLPQWPQIVCPSCQVHVIEPRERLKVLFSIGKLSGKCPKGCALQMKGNTYFSYCIALGLFVLAGRLWSTGFSFFFSLLFFSAGIVVMVWGINSSKVVVMGELENDS